MHGDDLEGGAPGAPRRLVLLLRDGMRVVEVVEASGDRERMPDEERDLERLGDLLERVERAGAGPHDVPQPVVERRRGQRGQPVDLGGVEAPREARLLELPEDVRGAHGGILEIRPRVALEGERLVEVESDDLVS